MKVDLDEPTGFLRVDQEGFEAIAGVVPVLEDRIAAGEELDEESRQILAAVDVVPGLRQSVRSFSDPLHQVFVLRANREQVTTVRYWYRLEGTGVVLPGDDGELLLFGTSVLQLPALTASLVSLGVRDGDPEAGAPLTTDGTAVDQLFSSDDAVRSAAMDRVRIPRDGWAWQVQIFAGDAAGDDTDDVAGVLLAIDSPASLLRGVSTGTGDVLRYEPASPVDVWTDVIEFLLPTDLPDPTPTADATA